MADITHQLYHLRRILLDIELRDMYSGMHSNVVEQLGHSRVPDQKDSAILEHLAEGFDAVESRNNQYLKIVWMGGRRAPTRIFRECGRIPEVAG